ncbi:MAG: hypothetical protein ACYTX0_51510, partial [Nostoc sp.]
IPEENCSDNPQYMMAYRYGLTTWDKYFNSRQLLTLVTYVEIIKEAKILIQSEYEWEKSQAISTYLALIFDLCADKNSRLSYLNSSKGSIERASSQHALNLMWNYSEIQGAGELWRFCFDSFASNYKNLCALLGTK